MKPDRAFWLITLSLFGLIFLPALVQEGMFLDGVTYSAISKNLAQGIGSVWSPHYTQTLYPEFHEHPPLVFILQAGLFKLCGSSFYTERLFTLLSALMTMLGIVKCWGLICSQKPRELSWLPILLWLLVPIVWWSYRNNMLENVLSVCCLFASYFIIKALQAGSVRHLIYGSFLIVLAFLSKGFVGLFPFVIPLIYSFTHAKANRGLAHFLIVLLSTGLMLLALFWVFPELKGSIIQYMNRQVLPALGGKREISTENRFNILFDLLLDLSIPIILTATLIFILRKQHGLRLAIDKKNVLLFLLIGVCASVPLILSLKQRKFYLIPSIPFYALALALMIRPHMSTLSQKLSNSVQRWMRIVTVSLLVITMGYTLFANGKIARDQDKLALSYAVASTLPSGAVIGGSQELCGDWSLVAYLSRVASVSLDCDEPREYVLMREKPRQTRKLNDYQVIELGLDSYTLVKIRTD